MEKEEIGLTLEKQRRFFASGKTLDVNYRLENLKKLKLLILGHEQELISSLWEDFHKPGFEVMGTETRLVISELNHTIRNLRKWSGKRRVRTPLLHFIAKSYILHQPYGQVLIMSPWNFPFLLSFIPLIGALAAGNCIVLKISRKAARTNQVITKILRHFPEELVLITSGEHSLSDFLLGQKFDYIFFTGSTEVGRTVMQKAAQNLIPVTLELGGKSPCVVAADAKLEFAAKRIAWGKFINAGQTCIAPDYLLVDERIKERFLKLLAETIKSFYGGDPATSKDFCHIINSDKTLRMAALIKSGKIITGGKTDASTGYTAPTILTDVSYEDPVMKEEIFGPVLPVIAYKDFDEIYRIIDMNPNPLAAYIFTGSRKLASEFLLKTQSGTAAVNETVMQIVSSYLPFGGIGTSGMGRYHGRKSFETFSNMKSVLDKSNLVDIFVRYPPYTRLKEKIIRLMLR